MKRRAAVTGVGLLTPAGDAAATLAALGRGERALAAPTLLDTAPFSVHEAGEVRGFDARPYFEQPKALKLTDRRTRLGVAACAMAVADAGLPRGEGALEELGVVLGTSGSDLLVEDLSRALAPDEDRRAAFDVPFFAERVLSGLNPLWLLVVLPNLASAHVGIQLGARGPNSTVMTDAAAGLSAVGEGASWIETGEADALLSGGADTSLQPVAWTDFEAAGLFAEDAAGARLLPGEGAAVLVLEERERALSRGARLLGEVLGHATASPAGEEAPEGALRRAVREALSDAGVAASSVGAAALDALRPAGERPALDSALREALGGGPPTVLDLTPSLGHSLAASGPAAAALLLSGLAPPGAVILVASLGLAGQAAALVLRREEAAAGRS